VTVKVFDAGGRHVKTLLDRDLARGSWSVTWDGTTDSGDRAASGTHFYRMETGGQVVTRRMTLLK
jgi:flagellar hook assembly protein FlgD